MSAGATEDRLRGCVWLWRLAVRLFIHRTQDLGQLQVVHASSCSLHLSRLNAASSMSRCEHDVGQLPLQHMAHAGYSMCCHRR